LLFVRDYDQPTKVTSSSLHACGRLGLAAAVSRVRNNSSEHTGSAKHKEQFKRIGLRTGYSSVHTAGSASPDVD